MKIILNVYYLASFSNIKSNIVTNEWIFSKENRNNPHGQKTNKYTILNQNMLTPETYIKSDIILSDCNFAFIEIQIHILYHISVQIYKHGYKMGQHKMCTIRKKIDRLIRQKIMVICIGEKKLLKLASQKTKI